MDPAKGLFRRRPSSASTRSRLRPQCSTGGITTAPSCPSSPKHNTQNVAGSRRSLGGQKILEDEEEAHLSPTTSTEAAEYAAAIEASRLEAQQLQQQQEQTAQQKKQQQKLYERSPRVSSAGSRLTGNSKSAKTNSIATSSRVFENNGSLNLQRSNSTVSGLAVRPRSSPAGLHSYTGVSPCYFISIDFLVFIFFLGSVPSSVHGSRADLREIDKGSAIYLGCSAPRNSSLSLASSRGSSGSSAPPSPSRTPPVSPRQGVRRYLTHLLLDNSTII